MSNSIVLAFSVFLFAASATPSVAQDVNLLTDAEKAKGWQLMFDGKSLAGWHSFKKTGITDNGWIVKDSSIYMRGPAAGALLAPEKFVYRNFEISIDWKVPETGNSGIFLRYLETEASENIRTGPESQICGKSHADYKTGTEITSPGACYAMYPPSKPWTRSSDEYNTFHVIMYEKRVAHFGNGQRLLEYEIGSEDWSTRYDKSKYASFPLYGDVHAGKLFLQDHASPVWYRNIKIRPLAEDPWTMKDFVWPDQAAGISLRPDRVGGPRILSVSRTEPGHIRIRFSQAAEWQLRLDDACGQRLETRSGMGDVVGFSLGGAQGPGSGSYLLSGTVGGRPVSQVLPVRSGL
jgi:hypothetical protein